jgi:hypothetical protein
MAYKIKNKKLKEVYFTKEEIEELYRKTNNPNFMGTYVEIEEKEKGVLTPKK